ncbi:hypothetical protein AA313_de0203494 [Arthrobotrys entomopaga]|nr:hypothetical protein AA313_de0203494 [Arthrobotrys entomopaga]
MDRLHHRITHILIFPRLQPGSGAKHTFVINDEQSKIQLQRRKVSDPTVSSLYSDLKIVLEFLSSKLGPSISHLLSRTLSPAILNHLMGSYLPECIPTDLDHFSEFDVILNETSAFEEYLDKAGWLEGSRGELRDWVSRAPRIWLNRRREEALDSLRRLFASGLGQRHRVERIERAKTVDGVIEEAPRPIDTSEDSWDTNWDLEIEDDEESKSRQKPDVVAPKSNPEPKAPADEEEDVSGWGFDDDLDIDDAPDHISQEKQNVAPAPKDEEDDENMEWGWGDDDNQTKAEKDSHTTRQANGKPKEKNVQDITLIETYSITSMPQEVINIILRTIQEAEKLSQPQYSNLMISSSTSGLLTIPTSILTAYRALCGIFYREDLNPAISIYNDCEWLEERLVELEKDVKNKSGPFSNFDLQASIKAISSFGRRTYWKEMDTKRVILNDLLDGAQGFEKCTQYPMSENCDTAVMSVIDAIQGIEMQWKDTLSRSALFQSLGQLMNSIITKFINDIEDLSDISADASAKLATYVADIGRLESLFILPDQPRDALPMTAVYCEKWLKFQYLGNILDSSMTEIMELWRDGALVDFGNEELMDLVRALFADSEKRSQVLAELRKAPRP